MTTMRMAGVSLCSLVAGFSVLAAPVDKSLKAYEDAQQSVKAKVEADVRKLFERELAMLADLKGKLWKVGDTVEVTVVSGRQHTVNGKFDGIKETAQGQYAVIAGQNHLLTDLDMGSRNRLLFGARPDLLVAYQEREGKRVQSEMAARQRQMFDKEMTRLGYDEQFLERSLRMGGRFYTADDLGLNLAEVVLEVAQDTKLPLPVGLIKIENRLNAGKAEPLPSIGVLILGEKVIGATTRKADNLVAEAWAEHACYVLRKDLGDDPLTTVADKLLVQFAQPDLQSAWSAKLKLSKAPDTVTVEVKMSDGAKKSVTCRRGVFKLVLVPSSLLKLSEQLNVLEIKNRILRATNYQSVAESECHKAGQSLLLPGAKPHAIEAPKEPVAPPAKPAAVPPPAPAPAPIAAPAPAPAAKKNP